MDRYKARLQIEDTIDGVLFHDEVIDEIFDLVIGSGIERQFFKKLISNIELIKSLGSKVIETKNFEKLKDAKDSGKESYSSHIPIAIKRKKEMVEINEK